MNFVVALKCGATPEVEAARCMKQLLQHSQRRSQLCPTLSTELVNELYKAIGLQTKITAEQLEAGTGFDWESAGCSHYLFHYNSIFFCAFERFLKQLCTTVLEEQENMVYIESGVTPIESLIQFLSIWSRCYMDLLKQNVNIQVQYLEEPLARINFVLYLGVQKIRDKYVCDYQQLDKMCTLLLNSALQGLFFLESHAFIAEGLSMVMECHYGTSKAFDEDAFKFFYKTFQVEKHKSTQCNAFRCLTRIMNKISTEEHTSTYRRFFSFLIGMPMQRVYFTLLKTEKTKRLKLATLNFLNNLQEQLLDLDCFSLVFLEAILALALHTDANISVLAAELYVIMARRKASGDDMLLKHILEFYFKEIKTLDFLPRFVGALWSNFTYMQSMHIYFDLMKAAHVPLAMRYFIAQFTIMVYRKMLRVPEKYAQQIKYVFQILPTLFRKLESQCVKGILLQLYSSTELELLQDSAGTVNELLYEFEDYFISVFTNDTNLIYPYLLNLFIQFTCCIEETKNFDKLEMCAVQIYQQYEELERTLQRLDESKAPSVKTTNAYSSILQKLGVLLQVDYVILDNLEQLIKTIHVRLIEKPHLCELAKKHQIFIDVYATELLVNSCIKLSYNEDLTKTAQIWLAQEIHILESYLLRLLTKAEAKTNAEILRLKTYFICLASLYYTFGNASGIYKLPLNLRSYHIMVEALLFGCLRHKPPTITSTAIVNEENMLLHTKYILRYQKSMFSKFTQLHTSTDIMIPSAVAWKICLHYGISSHKFNDELLTFMEALTKHHFKGFTHISAVLVYNLYKQNGTETKVVDIKRVIHAQKSFIDQLSPAFSPTLLCVNVVLKVLQLLQQSLKILPPTTGGNRLAALKHLNHYINNLNVNGDNVLPDIREQANALQNHMLNNAEQTHLKAYLSELGEYDKNKEKA